MKVNVYTKNDIVKNVELNMSVAEFFVLQNALLDMAGNMDANVEDRVVAVMMTEDLKDKEQIEIDEFN